MCLSGGEKQKVAIARAFFKSAHFAVMDEPSSALDPIAEYKLNQNMMEIARIERLFSFPTDCPPRLWRIGYICLRRGRLLNREVMGN